MSDDLHTYIEPELEARITALVLGEVSEFDLEELEQTIAEKPELQIFRRRMEAMHDLLGEVVKPEKDEAWQLSDDRRAELRRTFSKKAAPIAAVSKTITRAQWRASIGIAACLVVCLVIFSMMTPIGLKRAEMDQFTPEIVSYQVDSSKNREKNDTFAPRDEYGLTKDEGIVWAEDENGDIPVIGGRYRAEKEEKKDQRLAEVDKSIARYSRKTTGGVASKPTAPSSSMGRVVAANTDSATAAPVHEVAVPDPSVAFGDADYFGDGFGDRKALEGAGRQANQLGSLAEDTAGEDPFGGSGVEELKPGNAGFAYEESGKEAPLKQLNENAMLGRGPSSVDDDEKPARLRLDGRANANGRLAGERQLGLKKVLRSEMPARPDSSELAFKNEPKGRTVGDIVVDEVMKAPADRPAEADVKSSRALENRTEKTKSLKAAKKRPAARPIQAPKRPQALPEETSTSAQPFSTFSLNVADVSFKLAKVALLEKGQWPDAAKVRTEEFVNAFDYGDPPPRRGEPVACAIEQSAHPFLQQRNLLRIGMKTAALGRSTPLRLTVLLDNSGSMEREDREASVLAAMQVLASQLGPQDKITLVGFARKPRLLADRVSGDQAGQLVSIVANTPSEGGTNLEEALRLARKLAKRQHSEGAQDRVVLITDGVANLGNTVPEQLSREIEIMRQEGISFDACGVGAEDLNDEILEALTRKGDGRYYFLNRPEDADSGFAKQLAGALSPAAKNVKVQVVFNPKRVSKYRLLGFEKHRLNKEDFRNDKVDAAEMASEEAGNAVYQIEANPDGEGELGEVFVRFLDVNTARMVERSWTLPYESQAKSFDLAEPSMQLAATASMLGEKLHGTDAGSVRFSMISNTLGKLRAHYAADSKVQDLIRMCEKVGSGDL